MRAVKRKGPVTSSTAGVLLKELREECAVLAGYSGNEGRSRHSLLASMVGVRLFQDWIPLRQESQHRA